MEQLDELKMQLKPDQSQIMLDLNGVTLVDVEVVRFLAHCEISGVELIHCRPYVREWMTREAERKK